MINTHYDVVIIGGGPAGSVAGFALARAGLNTAIIERKSFPRETLCGEFLSAEVTDHLKDSGLFEKFLALNPNKISSFKLITERRQFSTGLPFEGHSLKRSVFDDFLLTEAKTAGADVFQPSIVEEVFRGEECFITKINSEGKIFNISSGLVIGAYGKKNVIDKKLNRRFTEKLSGYNGIKFHIKKEILSGIDDSCIYIFAGDKIYCGINSVSRGEAVVCFLDKRTQRNGTSLIHFKKLLNDNTVLSSLFNNQIPDLKQLEIYGAGNIYFGEKELVKNGIIMSGDAAHVIAPLAGDGIGMAIQSAKLISGIISSSSKAEKDFSAICCEYKSKWSAQFSRRIKVARFSQNMILQKRYFNNIPGRFIQLLIPSVISATRN
jgi:flavin-dependent dehydrogenase